MSDFWTTINEHLIQSSVAILDALSKTRYDPPEGSADVNVKSILESLLANKNPNPNPSSSITETPRRLQDSSIKDFALACALLASARSSLHELLSWIPEHVADLARSAFGELAGLYCAGGGGLVSEEKGGLVAELMHLVLPLLKERIQDSSIDRSADGDEVSAASARVPVGYAIVAAYQFRWFVTQVEYPILGKLSTLVIPCGLTALDHWSPEVKGQGMISFIHLAKNVNAAQLGWYEDVILDACCQNIASPDEIWHLVVEMSVLLVTNIQRRNPRSQWYERILNEMLGHLERQPRNKDRRIAWLTFIEPLFCSVGIVLLAHSRRIFPLFFQWMHADDEQTVLLVLKRIQTVIRLTWIRNTPFIGRLVDELVALYKEAALRTSREEIRTSVLEILALLQRCKGLQFEEAWNKHKDDPNLMALNFPASGVNQKNIVRCTEQIHSISI